MCQMKNCSVKSQFRTRKSSRYLDLFINMRNGGNMSRKNFGRGCLICMTRNLKLRRLVCQDSLKYHVRREERYIDKTQYSACDGIRLYMYKKHSRKLFEIKKNTYIQENLYTPLTIREARIASTTENFHLNFSSFSHFFNAILCRCLCFAAFVVAFWMRKTQTCPN